MIYYGIWCAHPREQQDSQPFAGSDPYLGGTELRRGDTLDPEQELSYQEFHMAELVGVQIQCWA